MAVRMAMPYTFFRSNIQHLLADHHVILYHNTTPASVRLAMPFTLSKSNIFLTIMSYSTILNIS